MTDTTSRDDLIPGLANMSFAEVNARMSELILEERRMSAEVNDLIRNAAIRGQSELDDGAKNRADNLERGMKRRQAAIELLRSRFNELISNNAVTVERGDGSDTAPTSPSLARGGDNALRRLETLERQGRLPDFAAERVEALVVSGDSISRNLAGQWVERAGADEYLSAFAKLCADPVRGHLLWSEPERAAYERVAELHSQMRAMSTGSTAGGEMIPLTLDPAILLTNDGSINPLRRVSRVVQTVTNSWQGVTSAGATSEWKTEAAEAADGSPALAEAPIPVYFGDSFVPYSFEIGMDALGFLDQLTRVLVDSADNLMATAYTTGPGSTAPTGVITALDGTASEVTPTTGETFASADVYKVQNALPARFQGRAQWAADIPTINTMAQFETTNGARLFPELGEGRLLRRPINELSNMKSTADINTAATADNHILLYGDFSNFVIVDRIGTTLEFIPNLIGDNGRPTGQRGAFLWFRTGSDVVVNQAFRVLNVATTA